MNKFIFFNGNDLNTFNIDLMILLCDLNIDSQMINK